MTKQKIVNVSNVSVRNASAQALRLEAERLSAQAERLSKKAMALETGEVAKPSNFLLNSVSSPEGVSTNGGQATFGGLEDDSALADLAEKIRGDRNRRQTHLAPELFGEPAWDILLDLFVARIRGKQLGVTSLGIASSVPMKIALRWIGVLTDLGLAERTDAPKDKGSVNLNLTAAGESAMRNYLTAISNPAT